jgi:DNA-binding response OmpR family regulator
MKPMPDTEPVRLLLVDDEAALREPLAEYLSRQGFASSARLFQRRRGAHRCATKRPISSCSTS